MPVKPPKNARAAIQRNFARLWERWPDESEKAYECFSKYLDLTRGNRTFLEAYRIYVGNPTVSQFASGPREWPYKFEWKQRAAAWDAECDRREREGILQAKQEFARKNEMRRQKMLEQEFEVGDLLIQKAKEMLAFPLAEQTLPQVIEGKDGQPTVQYVTIKPTGWRMRDAAPLLQTGSTVQRRSLQMATEIVGEELVAGEPDALTKARMILLESFSLFPDEPLDKLITTSMMIFGVAREDLLAGPEMAEVRARAESVDIDSRSMGMIPANGNGNGSNGTNGNGQDAPFTEDNLAGLQDWFNDPDAGD